jgi:DNA-directed RNA polymerase subunit RPC12/RpoP
MTIHYKCQDCGGADTPYTQVTVYWDGKEQEWTHDSNDRRDLRCNECQSWKIDECEEGEECVNGRIGR